jgi:hypothetical protein
MNRLLVVCASLVWILSPTRDAQATFIVLQPGPEQAKDAHVFGDAPDTNFGDVEYITFNHGGRPPHTPDNHGLIEFDLSSIQASSVLSATLILFHENNKNAAQFFDLFRNTSAWDEHTVTWSTRPSHDSTPTASALFEFQTGIPREWDVTAVVNEWLAGVFPNYGLTLARRSGVNAMADIASSDHLNPSFHPQLTLEISDDPPPPPPLPTPAPSALVLIASGMTVMFGFRLRRR